MPASPRAPGARTRAQIDPAFGGGARVVRGGHKGLSLPSPPRPAGAVMTDRSVIGLAALAFAMGLKSGRCDPVDVVALIERAVHLPEDDSLRIRLWSTRPPAWPQLGSDLHHRIEVALMPLPPDAARRDVHG